MANSIKFLQFFQKFHQILGIFPPQSVENQRSTDFTKIISLIFCAQFMFTTAAFFVFEAKSMLDYFAFFIIISVITSIFIYLIFIWQSQNTLKFIGNCEEFIEKSKNCSEHELILHLYIFEFYHSALLFFWRECIQWSHTMNWWEKLNFSINVYSSSRAVQICFILSWVHHSLMSDISFSIWEKVHTFYLVHVGWFSSWNEVWINECWIETIEISIIQKKYPFDWRTPSGFLVAWLVQSTGGPISGFIYMQFLYLVFGSCWLFIFIAQDITQEVVAFNILVKRKSDDNRVELIKYLCDMVHIHSDAKQ